MIRVMCWFEVVSTLIWVVASFEDARAMDIIEGRHDTAFDVWFV